LRNEEIAHAFPTFAIDRPSRLIGSAHVRYCGI
jgi:hypothetical protein